MLKQPKTHQRHVDSMIIILLAGLIIGLSYSLEKSLFMIVVMLVVMITSVILMLQNSNVVVQYLSKIGIAIALLIGVSIGLFR